ncbi:MAG: hypothetical protein ABFD69_03225 [Candidatus Sumerlaeia bacterium]
MARQPFTRTGSTRPVYANGRAPVKDEMQAGVADGGMNESAPAMDAAGAA